ncbi:MAG TPA: SIMPL domain-containing protein [bacterium]|nr:SIMPL domain-containing protein [bacterium]HPT30027.1 SIMPL domain-containing protein [bacterium]
MEHNTCECGCSSKHGGRIIFGIIAIVLLAVVILAAILRDRIVNQPQYQVSVTGQGKISYQPDIATVVIGVQIDKVAKAEDALKQLNDQMAKVSAAIKALGIKDEDLKTQNYSLLPQYDYVNNVSVLSGYNANEQLVVKVKDIKTAPTNLSRVVEEASKAGANQILGINYDLSNTEELKQQARLMAISDAKGKATVLADAAGVTLGDIVGWWENTVQTPYVNSSYSVDKGGMGGGGGTSYTPGGTQEIIIEMNMSYKLK